MHPVGDDDNVISNGLETKISGVVLVVAGEFESVTDTL